MSERRTFAISRRGFVAGAAAALAAPAIVRAQSETLKVAMLLPRSGFFAQAGQSCHRGALAAPKVLADLGYKVELMHIDVESNADTARTRAERAINDGANCLVGAFDSGLTLAIAQVAEQRQVPLVINVAAAPQITEQGYKYVFRNFPTAVTILTDDTLTPGDAVARSGATTVDARLSAAIARVKQVLAP